MYGRRRRDGLREFMEGFNSTYETTGKVLRNMEMAKVMKEAPTEYQQYTPEQIAQIEEAAKNGTLETGDNGTYKGFEPAAKRYSMTGYDGDKMPTERELLGLRTSRMADIEAKYGNVAESLRLRGSADDMQWRNEQRDRAKLEQGRADEEYGRKEAARTELANVDGYTNAAAQQGIEEILANPNLSEEAKAPYRQWAGKTMKQGLSEAAGRLRSAGNIEGGDAALERAMKLEKEGVPRLLEAVKRGARGKELVDTFNSTGIFRAKDIQVKEVKDKYGNPDYIITGDINGRQGQLRASELEAQLMTPEQRIAIAQRDQGLAIQREGVAESRALRAQAAEDRRNAAVLAAREKVNADMRDYFTTNYAVRGPDGKVDEKASGQLLEDALRQNPTVEFNGEQVPLQKVWALDSNLGRAKAAPIIREYMLKSVAEQGIGGKKIGDIQDIYVRPTQSGDYGLFGPNKGLGVGRGMLNKITGGEVVVLRTAGADGKPGKEYVVDKKTFVDSHPYGSLIVDQVPEDPKFAALKEAERKDAELAKKAEGSRQAYVPQGRAGEVARAREGEITNAEVRGLAAKLRREEAQRRLLEEAESFKATNAYRGY